MADPESPPSSPFKGFEDKDIPKRKPQVESNFDSDDDFSDVSYRVLPANEAQERKRKMSQEVEIGQKEGPKTPKLMLRPPTVISGTSSRVKISVVDKYPTCEMGDKLPKTEKVLLCFFHHLLEAPTRKDHSNPMTVATKSAKLEAAKKTTENIKDIWRRHFTDALVDDRDKKMIKDDHKINENIIKLYDELMVIDSLTRRKDRKDLASTLNRTKAFKERLLVPFDITLKNPEEKLKTSGILNWKEDLEHLNNQLKPEQVGSLAGVDKRQLKVDGRRLRDKEELERARQKSAFDCSNLSAVLYSSDDDVEETEDMNKNDPEYYEPESNCNKPKKINVMGPVQLGGMGRNVSAGDSVVIAATVATILGKSLDETNISLSTAKYQRKKVRKQTAAKLRENYVPPEMAAVGFDGKTVKLKGPAKMSNRFAVVINTIGEDKNEKILAIPETSSGSGKAESEVVIGTLKENGIKTQVKVILFDTTSTNTSAEIGCCKFVEEYVGFPVLYCACRHHTSELIIGEAVVMILGVTKDPGVKLFRRLKGDWDKLDLDPEHFTVMDRTDLPDWMVEEADKVLSWGLVALEEMEFFRGDYKECLQLAVLYLGGTVKNFRMRYPGADSNARWMSKIIYFLKMALLESSFQTTEEEKKQIRSLAKFSAVAYVKYWLEVPLTVKAARNDLDQYILMKKYEEYEPKLTKVHKNKKTGVITYEPRLSGKMNRHEWYWTGQLVPLALCDEGLTAEEREELALAIHKTPKIEIKTGKPKFPNLEYKLGEPRPKLSSFVTENSWLIFQILGIEGDFLSVPMKYWPGLSEYKKFEYFCKNLPVLNDSAEVNISSI